MDPLIEFSGIALTLAEILIGVLLLIIGAIAALLLRPKKDAAMALHLEQVKHQQAELQGRLSQFAQDSAERDAQFRERLDTRLTDVSDRVGRSLLEQRESTGEQMKQLHERLALIDQAQKTLDQLSGEVVGLQSILSNKQARGAFGERQMQDLIADYLPPSSYSFQARLSNGTQVDALIHMPNGQGDIAIDSKFPLESWRRLNANDREADNTLLRRSFAGDINTHVKAIASKYLIFGETHETALLFLPSEAVYAELYAQFPEVVENAFKQRVMIVSPTTFMATLHTIRAVMKDAAMREQAHIIQREVEVLATDVARLDSRVEKLQSHFRQSVQDVEDIRKSTKKIVSRGEKIANIDVEEPAKDETLPRLKGA